MGAPQGFGFGFRNADVANLALLDQPSHRADGFLDRDVGIDAMQVIQIDVIEAEPLKAIVARFDAALRPAVNPVRPPLLVPDMAPFGGKSDLVAPRPQYAANKAFVFTTAVEISSIE